MTADRKSQQWRMAHAILPGYYAPQERDRTFFLRQMRGPVISTIAEVGRAAGHPLAILEVGCGGGTDSICLALQGHRLTTVDVSDYLLAEAARQAEQAAALFPDRSLHLKFAHADVFDLGEFSGQYDLVLSFGLVVIWRDIERRLRALDNMRAALKPGGLLLLGTTNTLNPLFKLVPVNPLVADLADHNLALLEREVSQAGFHVLTRGATGLSPHFDQWLAYSFERPPLRLANWVFERLPSRWQLPVAPHIFVLAAMAERHSPA